MSTVREELGMNGCDRIEKCAFFTDKMDHQIPALAEVMKQSFCRGEWSTCARNTVAESLGKDAVPLDMYPNQYDRAQQMIGATAGS
jgi:hypothetical protein